MNELRLDGPVVIGESDTDPGDFGEPRVFSSDGVTYVTVPAANLWPPATEPEPGPVDVPTALTPERLAKELDNHLPRMAFQQYGEFYAADPFFDVEAYYLRVAEAILAALSPERA